MPYHSYRLLVDWSGNGQFNINSTSDENVTADVISGIRARAGIDYSQIFPQAVAGRASFTLRNDHRRYSGYDTGNTLGSGLLRGVLLQVWCAANTAFGAGGAWLPIWGGVVDYVQYGTSPSGLDTAEIHCVGNLASMQDARVEISIGSSSIASIGTDIATAVWRSTRIQETGNAVFRYIMASGNPRHRYYLETSNSPTITGYIYSGRALAGLRSLAQDTGSRLYEGPEGAVRLYSTAAQSSLSGGAARFTLRHTSTGTSASTYHVTSASPEIAQRDVINRVSVSWTTSSSRTYSTNNPYGSGPVHLIDQTPWRVTGGNRKPTSQHMEGQSEFYRQEATPGDSIAGTLHNAGRTDAYLEWTQSATLPTFERGDPDPTARLQAITFFTVNGLVIAQPAVTSSFIEDDQPSAWATRRGYVGRPRFRVFVLGSTRGTRPDTELTIPSTDNRLNDTSNGLYWNAANFTLSRTANVMTVKILLTQSTLHEYTIRVRLENLHRDLVVDPVPQLQSLDISVHDWSVESPPTETTHTYSDSTSISQWGVQSYDARVHWITTESQAQTYAQQVLDARAQPVTRYRVAYILDQKSSLTDIPQVSDIVDLEYRGTTTKCWVDSARHDISRRRHLCELLLTPV